VAGFPVYFFDPLTGKRAKIINGGAISVLPPEYNGIYSAELTVINEVKNLAPAAADSFFVGNMLVITGDKNISQTDDATVSIYAAAAADEALSPDNLEVLSIKLPRSGERIIPNMNIRTINRGAFINCVSDQVNVNVSLFGYHTLEDK
jgi:hypothetical protein